LIVKETPPMARTTPATLALQKAGVAFGLATYDYDPDAARVGLQAAEALGVPAAQVLKTLMTLVDGKPVCAILASDQEVAMKRLAAAMGGKSATMMPAADAERITGYKVGGVSPFGQKKRVPTVVDRAALAHAKVFVNGGQRGLQAELAPADLVSALGATVVDIA
jgi:Cys-tRNA(Pro)/Cys-tRNA(Cys) deacylase